MTLKRTSYAIHDATGIWFEELPITPEKIVKALKEKGGIAKISLKKQVGMES